MNKVDERAQEARLDWALGEVVGEKAPPDLLAAVRARLVAPAVPERQPMAGFWFAAACVLLGVSVIVAVWLDRRSGVANVPVQRPDAPMLQQQETEPAWVTVGSAEEIGKLPADCSAVRWMPNSAQDMEALGRLRHLTCLDLGRARAVDPCQAIDAAMLQAVGKLSTLRELRLGYRMEIEPRWLQELESLPLLDTLRLKFVQVDADAAGSLARLGLLRRLDLEFDKALDRSALQHLVRIPTLRELSLRGSGGLNAADLTVLGKATRLETLDLSCFSFESFRTARPGIPPALLMSREERDAASAYVVVTDEVLQALQPLSSLRGLKLSACCSISEKGLAALATLPLRSLDLSYCDNKPALLTAIPSTVERLSLASCSHLVAADFLALVRLPRLEDLDVSECYWLTDAELIALLQHCPLRRLDLRGCTKLTVAALPSLLDARTLLEVDATGLPWVDAAVAAQLRDLPRLHAPSSQDREAEPAWVEVHGAAEIAGIPDACAAVRLFPESAQDVEALTRLRYLTHLDLGLAATDQEHPPLDATMLQAVGRLHTLRELRLDYRKEIQPGWLDPLGDLPLLQTLGLRFVPVDDAAAARLVRLGSLSRLELTFDNQLGDGGVAAIAGIRTLRILSLQGCGNITPRGMAALGRCTQLEQLDLSCVNGITTWLLHNVPEVMPRVSAAGIRALEQRLLASDMSTSKSVGRGVDDDVLVALSGLGRLSVLRLGGAGPVTERGLGAIAGLPLRELELWVRDAEFAPFVAQLPPTVEKLGLGWCNTLTDADLAALARSLPRLRAVDLTECTAITDAGVRALLQGAAIRRLVLHGCTALTSSILPALLAKQSLHEVDATGLPWVDAHVEQQLRGLSGVPHERPPALPRR